MMKNKWKQKEKAKKKTKEEYTMEEEKGKHPQTQKSVVAN